MFNNIIFATNKVETILNRFLTIKKINFITQFSKDNKVNKVLMNNHEEVLRKGKKTSSYFKGSQITLEPFPVENSRVI